MDGACTRSSAGRLSHGDGGAETGTGLSKLQLLPWFKEAVVKVVAADDDLAGSATAAKAGKRRSTTAKAGLACGVKVLLIEVAEMIRTKFERSIPAAKFRHVAYIR